MGIKQLYNDNLWKLQNKYGDVAVMAPWGIRLWSKQQSRVPQMPIDDNNNNSNINNNNFIAVWCILWQ